MRRVIWIAGAAVTATVLVGGGWLAAGAFTSPEQWQAQASAPEPQPVLAEVLRGDLVDERTLGASIVPSSQLVAAVLPAAEAPRSIVTEAPVTPGAPVATGTVLLRVNGQPVFAFASAFPFYRDLGVGDSGPDVTALQQNLVGLGLLGAADGNFGAATARAVAELYREARATAPTRPDPVPPSAAEPAAGRDAGPDAKGMDAATAADGEAEAEASHPYLPLSATVAVPALPAVLAGAPAVGADLATGGEIAFAAPDAVLRLMVEPDLAGTLVVGADLECRVAADEPFPCRVTRVFDATPTAAGVGEGDGVMAWADVVPASGTIEATRLGERATVTVDVATLATDALLVPASALAQQTETRGTVLRQTEDGSFRTVEVGVVAALDGTIAITGDVRPGALLRVDR
ncbi:peptidoglycan-binding protein [Microbacterium sp. NEAU-LLC]|uniref:Peptidoglycan-binding protein n=1 Tax=Microbacterium helvum TaxID=2773713 RepID=A0ABR8NSI2_9MICO|nr:peptidoglycan-binding domain-containing protein [Microbacterium helvum]MBD3943124.1 peptidoglycan-binding protein [Microbacterium helvum]